MNCQEALCVSSPHLCSGISLKGCINLIFFRILNSEFSTCQGQFQICRKVNLVSILSLTIWFWFSEPQNKPFLLIGKPTVSRFLPFLSFCFTFEYQTKVSQVFQFEFLLFYKNYIYFCWRFLVTFCLILKLKTKLLWFAFLF